MGGGKITIASGVDIGFANHQVYTNGNLQIDGIVSGVGGYYGGGISKGGAGTLLLNNAGNKYDGVMAVLGGTLKDPQFRR